MVPGDVVVVDSNSYSLLILIPTHSFMFIKCYQ